MSTRLIHHPYRPPDGFEAVVPAVHKASTVFFPNVQALRSRDWRQKEAYTYGLHGTPTTFTLEERLATLEGARYCVLAPSGLSALALVNLALLKPGDEVLLPDNAYGPSKDLARTLLADLGVLHRIYDPLRAASLPALIGPATKLLWLEAPGSVTMEFPDMVGLVRAGRQAGLTIALDNTWGAGLAFQPFALRDPQGGQWGVDLCMHALTKYPSGGGDVLMGSITSVDRAFHDRVLTAHMRLGLGVGANDAEAILRSLPSIELRYEAQDHAARELARWLQAQDAVAQVLHPALAGSPGHEHWAQQCTRAAGIFSILLHESYAPEAVDAFVDALRVFRLGYSWGGPVSLAVPYPLEAMRQDRSHLRGHLVRLCIGLEEKRLACPICAVKWPRGWRSGTCGWPCRCG
ncbi:MAG: cystathionine beta-lyase, partial [Betaproteobacteria bacterium]|nr:cystathionine beta-lyase [Betaproteobacteria bacterium]